MFISFIAQSNMEWRYDRMRNKVIVKIITKNNSLPLGQT